MSSGPPAVVDLPANSEVRFHVSGDKPGTVKLTSGNAELFGVELAVGKEYSLAPGKNGSIVTFFGASLELRVSSQYVVPDPPTVLKTVEVHQKLEARREVVNTILRELQRHSSEEKDAAVVGAAGGDGVAASESIAPDAPVGPRVIVVGPEDSGKSTLCKTLLAYGARMGWCPLFVDCDLGQGELAVPGCLAAAPVDRSCLSVEHGLHKLTPLALFMGSASAGTDMKLYAHLAGVLGGHVDRYLRQSVHAAASGAVINTMGWVDGAGYDLLLSTIRAIHADVVLVLGQDKLLNDLERDLKCTRDWSSMGKPGVGPVIEKVTRSEGVVARSSGVRKDARKNRIREYFYGKDGALAPHPRTLAFKDLTLLKLSAVTVDAMSMPVGYKETEAGIRVRAAETAVTPDLASCIVGVPYAHTVGEVPNAISAGFALIKTVNMEEETVEALFPSSEPPPSTMFVKSAVQWVE